MATHPIESGQRREYFGPIQSALGIYEPVARALLDSVEMRRVTRRSEALHARLRAQRGAVDAGGSVKKRGQQPQMASRPNFASIDATKPQMPRKAPASKRAAPPPLEWSALVAWIRAEHERRRGVRLSVPAAEDRARGILVMLGFAT